jgi:hypothetical protein
MMNPQTGLASQVMERILELSADAHIERRGVGKDSPAFDGLTGAIAAYGKVLALLASLQQREEFDLVAGQSEFSEYVAAVN